MRDSRFLWLLGAGAVGWLLYSQRQQAGDVLQTGVEDVKAAVAGWKSVNQGPQWVPVINGAEAQLGIPADLLARMAYQESRFRSDVITGTTPNPSSGALGILQMLPQFFASVRGFLPFTDSDTAAQIQEAGQELVRLANHYSGDWGLAVAAYNDGQGNIDNYLAGTRSTLPQETKDYVAQVFTDVPVAGATMLA